MLTMMNQKGRLYTINHLHHPQHSQQPESLHTNDAEYLVYKSNACISTKDRNWTSSSAGTMSTAANLQKTAFIAMHASIGKYSSRIDMTDASNTRDQCHQQVCSKQQASPILAASVSSNGKAYYGLVPIARHQMHLHWAIFKVDTLRRSLQPKQVLSLYPE